MSIVLDTQAILILYLGEKGADRIADLLSKVTERKIKGYMNIINLAELYGILARKSVKVADEKEQNLKSYGVKIVSVKANDELWREAAILKAGNSLSLADAFAAATAKTLKATLVTGSDPDFQRLGGEIEIERV